MKVIYNNKEVANTTLNYNELFNKPLLNSHELVGNTSLNDIGVYSKPQVDNLIASTRSIKVVSALPTPLVANTMYYVGPDQNNLYHIYLVDSSLTLIDLGMSQDAVYLGGNGIDISSDNEISVVFDNETLMLNSEGELYVRPATQNVEGVVSYDNVSIKKNSSGKIYVPTTKSGDRHDVYPYTNSSGYTDVGHAINFYAIDTSTSANNTLVSVTNPNAGQGNVGDLYVNNYSNSSRSGTIVTRGNAAQFSDTTTIFGATEIPRTGGIDLNSQEYTAPGTYYVSSNFTASNITNCPTNGRAFRMLVRNPIGQELSTLGTSSYYQYRIREIITYQNEHWTQQCNSNNTAGLIEYSSWNKVLNSGNLSNTLTEVSDVDSTTVAVSKAAIQDYTYKATSAGSTLIPNSSDLNTATFTKPGNYYVNNNAAAASLANCPTGAAFKMFVDNQLGTDDIDLGSVPLAQNAYRVRTIEDLDGRRWTQACSHNANSSTLYFGDWKRVLSIDSGLPYVISEYVYNTKFNKTYTDPVTGRTFTALMGGWAGVSLSSSNLGNVKSIRESVRYEYASAIGGTIIKLSGLNNGTSGMIEFTGSVPGNNSYVLKYAATAASGGIYTTLGTSSASNIDGYTLDITWSRTGGNYWIGIGTLSVRTSGTDNYLGTLCVSGEGQTNYKPHVEMEYSPTPRYCCYTVEFFRN